MVLVVAVLAFMAAVVAVLEHINKEHLMQRLELCR